MAKVVTIRDVARVAGVSPMTVSRVLNDRPDVSPSTRQHVQKVIDDLGYSPSVIARNLSQGRSSTIGVVSSGLEFYGPSRTLVGIERQANELGYTLMVRLLHNPLDSRGERALNELVANQVAGIIWAVAEIGDRREWLYGNLKDEMVPFVFLNIKPRSSTTAVSVDNRLGGQLAATHLLQQGYQKIAIITGPDTWWEARQRELGWRETLQKARCKDLDRLRERGDWTAASGHNGMVRLLQREPDLEAVFVCNDSMALGALQAALDYGRAVPDDLAIIGFDDIPESAYFTPPLTTIRQDLLEVGCRAVSLLHQQLLARRKDEALAAELSIVEPELIVRKSSIKESR
ncbi:MAG: LacI family DNA-binding transcriptional regulator [Candidatus Promineifilaceae bacterium]|jgi:LacI family transcriptional regulator